MSWETVKLGEVITHRKGSITISDDEKYKLCRVQLHRKGILLREILSGALIRTKKQQLCKANDFIVAEMDAKVGGYGFIPKELDGAIVSSHYYLFEVNENLLKQDFLAVLNKTQTLQNQIKATGSTNYARVSPKDVLAWEIPLPNIEEQESIIEKIQIVETNKNQISTELNHQLALVKELRQAYLREAMQGKLVPQDERDEPAEILLEKIKAEKEKLVAEKRIRQDKPLPPINSEEIPFEIPSNWTWCRLGEVSEMCLGKMLDHAKNKGTLQKYIGNINVRWGKFDLSNLKEMRFTEDEEERYSLKEGDLVICEGGMGIGRTAIWKGQGTIKIQKALHRVRTNQDVLLSEYLYACIRSDSFSLRLAEYFTGAGIPHLTGRSLAKYTIPLPPLAEQERIVAKLEKLMKFCDELEANIRQDIKNADYLLQTALKEALEPNQTESKATNFSIGGGSK